MEKRKKVILVTGSNGFIAKNLVLELRNREYEDILLCNRDTTQGELENYLKRCDVLVHLAGVNRPDDEREYYIGNVGFTKKIIDLLEKYNKRIDVIFSSTIQQKRHICYEESKKKAENLLKEYTKRLGGALYIFRLPNVFGKWCRPAYNSVVATFCYNISHNLGITIDSPDAQMELVYIDDVIDEMISCITLKREAKGNYVELPVVYHTTVGEIAAIIESFKQLQENLEVPNLESGLVKRLYSTYLSYMEPEDYRKKLKMNRDERGSFTEFLHLKDYGQISVNVTKPEVVKGNHWHHTKVEKFLVVKGNALIKLRHMITGEILEYTVSGEQFEVIDIPVGYTHNIMNTGKDDLVTLMWANEVFNKEKPDTYYKEV